MCLAIYRPPGKSVPEPHLHQGWQHNSDGAGFAYIEGSRVKFVKGLMTYKEFLAAYSDYASRFPNSPFLIHFRIRSTGARDEGNTHPFPFKHGVAIHNGTIDGTGAVYGTGNSDTSIFMEKYGDKLSHKLVSEHKKDIENALGAGNKLVLLYNNGKHIILNERMGHTKDDVWYSNATYVPRQMNGYESNVYGMVGD